MSTPPPDPECRHPKKKIGILAFGSLIGDPGSEIALKIIMRIKCATPFPVEYGRYSNGTKRAGAPTLVPDQAGCSVSAEILVLDDSVAVAEARNMLWRREADQMGTGNPYPAGTRPNSIVIREFEDSPYVDLVLYTDFHPEGKQASKKPEDLAQKAIDSVENAVKGKDGITYLIDNIDAGIVTPLTNPYRGEILKKTATTSLPEALAQLLKI